MMTIAIAVLIVAAVALYDVIFDWLTDDDDRFEKNGRD